MGDTKHASIHTGRLLSPITINFDIAINDTCDFIVDSFTKSWKIIMSN